MYAHFHFNRLPSTHHRINVHNCPPPHLTFSPVTLSHKRPLHTQAQACYLQHIHVRLLDTDIKAKVCQLLPKVDEVEGLQVTDPVNVFRPVATSFQSADHWNTTQLYCLCLEKLAQNTNLLCREICLLVHHLYKTFNTLFTKTPSLRYKATPVVDQHKTPAILVLKNGTRWPLLSTSTKLQQFWS